MHFVREPLAGRVVFGAGSFADVAEVAHRVGTQRLVVIASTSAHAHVAAARELLGPALVDVVVGARAHVPTTDVDATLERVTGHDSDGVVAIGGGSAIGLAKAVAVQRGLAVIAVPTTYSGSEMTAVYGTSADGRKHTARDPAAAPRAVIYDPELTYDLPVPISAETGINAVAHCVEALYAPATDPTMTLVARAGLQRLIAGLPRLAASPRDPSLREELLVGAYAAGTALATCGMGVHHRICHVLGGEFMAAHGRLNAAVLPHVVALNAPAAPALADALATALGRDDVAAGLWDLIADLGAPATLAAAGAGDAEPEQVAARVMERPLSNPTELSHDVVRRVVERARQGARPDGRPAHGPDTARPRAGNKEG